MQKQEILEKYKKEEERLLLSKVLDKLKLSEKSDKIENTNFLDPLEQKVIQKFLTKIKKDGIFFGGFDEAERKALFIIPEKYKENKEILLKNQEIIHSIRIELPKSLKGRYSHRDYLGALMKLGIKREKIGDILVDENGADIIVYNDIVSFLLTNLSNLTRFKGATVTEINLNELKEVKINFISKTIHVSSMRLDNIVSELAQTSRSKASEILTNQKVFVNYECETKNTKIVKVDDLITIRGKGKFKITKIIGNTKKGKMNIMVQYYN